MNDSTSSLTDVQRAQAALVRILHPPPPSPAIPSPRPSPSPSPSPLSPSLPSVIKVQLVHPLTGQTQIRRLPIAPFLTLPTLMSSIIALCDLRTPFLLSYLPPSSLPTSTPHLPLLLLGDAQLHRAFALHHAAVQGGERPAVMKLHVVHRKERPPSSRRSSLTHSTPALSPSSPSTPLTPSTSSTLSTSTTSTSSRAPRDDTPRLVVEPRLRNPAVSALTDSTVAPAAAASALRAASPCESEAKQQPATPCVKSACFTTQPMATEASVQALAGLVEALFAQVAALEARLAESDRRWAELKAQGSSSDARADADRPPAPSPTPTVAAEDTEGEEEGRASLPWFSPPPTPPPRMPPPTPPTSTPSITPPPSSPSSAATPSPLSSSMRESFHLEPATPLSLASSAYLVCPPSASASALFPPPPLGAGVSSRYVGMLKELEGLGYNVRALNEFALDEHGGEHAELSAVIEDLRLYYAPESRK